MQPGSIRIGRIAGVDIGIHWSWVFIFALITWSFAEGTLEELIPEWGSTRRWVAGAVISGVFFLSILAHEMSHSLVAKARGIDVKGITLFVFGGVSNLGRESRSAAEEFQIAIVGPATSLAIGAVFALLWFALQGPAPREAAIAAHLAFINGIIGVFNMLPGFPLDGGRVFRAIVWARNRNLLRATRTASRVGEWVAYGLMAIGAVQFLTFSPIGGVWLFLIGLFLRNASSASYEQMVVQNALEGLTARQLARGDHVAVPPDMTVEQLVSDLMLAGRGRAYPVTAGQELLGLITLTDVQHLERGKWATTPVFRAMTPLERLHTVAPSADATDVLQLMSERDVNQVPILDGRLLVGVISRGDVFRLIQVRRQVAVEGEDPPPP